MFLFFKPKSEQIEEHKSMDKCIGIAAKLSNLARSEGASEVIVMISMPDGSHSSYAVNMMGACIPLRGLLETGYDKAIQSIKYKNEKVIG